MRRHTVVPLYASLLWQFEFLARALLIKCAWLHLHMCDADTHIISMHCDCRLTSNSPDNLKQFRSPGITDNPQSILWALTIIQIDLNVKELFVWSLYGWRLRKSPETSKKNHRAKCNALWGKKPHYGRLIEHERAMEWLVMFALTKWFHALETFVLAESLKWNPVYLATLFAIERFNRVFLDRLYYL